MEHAESSYSVLILSAGSGRSPIMNRLLVVDVPPELQIKRVTKRDNNTAQQIQAIMEAAHETDSPVIIQASRGARKYSQDNYGCHKGHNSENDIKTNC